MIEFYGEISLSCKKVADKRKKHYFAVWTLILTVIVGALAVGNGVSGGNYLSFTVFACILAALTAFLFAAPSLGKAERSGWVCRVSIEEDTLTFIQYTDGGEVKKTRPLKKVKKVIKMKTCYLLYVPDGASIVVCQRSLLKRGTFEEFESLFRGKIKNRAD